MLLGAQYANLLEGAKTGNDRRSLGIGEAIALLGNLATHSDPVQPKPERQLTPEEELFNSWKP